MPGLFQTLLTPPRPVGFARPPVAVLAYHDVKNIDRVGSDLYSVTERNFRRQVAMLVRCFDIIAPDRIAGEPAPGSARVVITFDDGHRNNYELAFPVLKSCGVPAVFFVSTAFLDSPGYLRWQEVDEMAEAGMIIGSHGHSHADFGALSPDRTREELALSHAALQSHRGGAPRDFAYPYGNAANVKDLDRALLRACGYARAFVFGGGAFSRLADPFRIPRLMVLDVTAPTLYRQIMTECRRASQ
jgi:peptidoglycan/xylan/chitin deacetylase (PgdA/CDA1 family)